MRALLIVMLLASVAHADAWTASCPISMHHGLCMRFGRAASTACDRKRARWVAVRRDPALVEKALAEMTAKDGELANADRAFEALIADPLPRLHFGRPDASKRSTKRFQRWYERQHERSAALAKRYRELGALPRAAQIAQMIAQHLVTSPTPHDFLHGEFAKDKREAYCDRMTEIVEPLLARALLDFAACAAAEPANRWTAICARELETIDPETFPPMREKLPKPSVTGGVDVTLEGEPQQ